MTTRPGIIAQELFAVPPVTGRPAVSAQLSPEQFVRKFFDCYTNGRPDDFDQVVAPDYTDHGHTPPGRGPGGARDDYHNAVRQAGAVIRYTIDALVADCDTVAAAWTGTLPGDTGIAKGLSLLRSTRHALIASKPACGSRRAPQPPRQLGPRCRWHKEARHDRHRHYRQRIGSNLAKAAIAHEMTS